MTMLGYEYLKLKRSGAVTKSKVDKSASLGLLRQRKTRGVQDLQFDIEHLSLEQLHSKQLSFSKSRGRSRVHRLTYPDYVEVKVFDEDGEVVGQHRFIGLYTSTVYTMNPRLIPILRRKVEQVMELSDLEWAAHESREMVRVLEVFPRDELFQSSVRELYDTVTAVNQIQERRQTRLFVRKDPHRKFVNCMVYIPRDRYTTEQREKIEAILTAAFHAEESEFTTHFSESILVRCHFVLRVNPSVPLEFDAAELEGQIVQATLAWEDRLRLRLYHCGQSLPLSDVLPILENLGLRVVTERPYGVRAHDGIVYWVQEFSLIYSLSHNIAMAGDCLAQGICTLPATTAVSL